jgi:phosphinothricin acetyltransferase
MSAPVIRPATFSDIPVIASIYGDIVANSTASFELEPPGEAEMAARMRHLTENGFPYLTAELDGAVAGYAYAGAYRIRPGFRFTVEDSLYIAREAQRRGVGRALLNALIDESARRGFRQMVAVIGDPQSQTVSVALHKACGFRIVGTVDAAGFKHGRWLDSFMMQRALGDGVNSPPAEINP